MTKFKFLGWREDDAGNVIPPKPNETEKYEKKAAEKRPDPEEELKNLLAEAHESM